MSRTKLDDIESLIDQLDVRDQVRLLQYLAPRIAGGVLARTDSAPDANDAWRRFRALGDRLAATSVPGAPSLTDAVSQLRR